MVVTGVTFGHSAAVGPDQIWASHCRCDITTTSSRVNNDDTLFLRPVGGAVVAVCLERKGISSSIRDVAQKKGLRLASGTSRPKISISRAFNS